MLQDVPLKTMFQVVLLTVPRLKSILRTVSRRVSISSSRWYLVLGLGLRASELCAVCVCVCVSECVRVCVCVCARAGMCCRSERIVNEI